MNTKIKSIRKVLVAGAIGIMSFALPIESQVGAKAPENCKTFSSGRTTCSYSNGSGGTSWNSYNPYSGYSSNGYRQRSGGSSWGSYDFSLPSGRTGTRSYSSSGGGSSWDNGFSSTQPSTRRGSRSSSTFGGIQEPYNFRGNSSIFGDCYGC